MDPLTGEGMAETWVSNGKPISCSSIVNNHGDYFQRHSAYYRRLPPQMQWQSRINNYGRSRESMQARLNNPDLSWSSCKKGNRFIKKFYKIMENNVNTKRKTTQEGMKSRIKDVVDRDTGSG